MSPRPRNPARRQPAACPLRTAPAARHLPLRTVPAALWCRPSLTSGPPVTLPDPVGASARPARPALPRRRSPARFRSTTKDGHPHQPHPHLSVILVRIAAPPHNDVVGALTSLERRGCNNHVAARRGGGQTGAGAPGLAGTGLAAGTELAVGELAGGGAAAPHGTAVAAGVAAADGAAAAYGAAAADGTVATDGTDATDGAVAADGTAADGAGAGPVEPRTTSSGSKRSSSG